MTKTCFRGGCTKAYAGARAAEYGPSAKRTNATKSCPAHRSWSRTCALPPVPSGRVRTAEEAKSKHKRISAGKRDFVFGTRRVLRTWSRECRAYVCLALSVCGAHLESGRFALKLRAMRRAPPSAPPRRSRNKLATHACHKAFEKGLAKPGFVRSPWMTCCLSVFPEIMRVCSNCVVSLRCLAIFARFAYLFVRDFL